jgi:plasmid stabilization system protein ParE
MASRPDIVQEAEEELGEAAAFYEAQRPGLALRFVAAVERTITRAAEAPLAGARLADPSGGTSYPAFPTR